MTDKPFRRRVGVSGMLEKYIAAAVEMITCIFIGHVSVADNILANVEALFRDSLGRDVANAFRIVYREHCRTPQ